MRYAIFGDIHANLEGLKAVLADAKEHGITHFALTVENLQTVYDLMVEKGINFISQPEVNDSNTAIVAFCRDYEGNFIELVELL